MYLSSYLLQRRQSGIHAILFRKSNLWKGPQCMSTGCTLSSLPPPASTCFHWKTMESSWPVMLSLSWCRKGRTYLRSPLRGPMWCITHTTTQSHTRQGLSNLELSPVDCDICVYQGTGFWDFSLLPPPLLPLTFPICDSCFKTINHNSYNHTGDSGAFYLINQLVHSTIISQRSTFQSW